MWMCVRVWGVSVDFVCERCQCVCFCVCECQFVSECMSVCACGVVCACVCVRFLLVEVVGRHLGRGSLVVSPIEDIRICLFLSSHPETSSVYVSV